MLRLVENCVTKVCLIKIYAIKKNLIYSLPRSLDFLCISHLFDSQKAQAHIRCDLHHNIPHKHQVDDHDVCKVAKVQLLGHSRVKHALAVSVHNTKVDEWLQEQPVVLGVRS